MFGKTPECPCLTLHSKVAISHSINETLFPNPKLLLSIEGGPGNRHLACRRIHLEAHLEGGSHGTLAEVGRRIGDGHRTEVGHRTIGVPSHVGRRLEGQESCY